MSLVARFHAHSVTKYATSEQILLQPVYSQNKDHPNYKWSQASPSGKLEMSISNPAAMGQIEPGEEYEITIRKVAKAVD